MTREDLEKTVRRLYPSVLNNEVIMECLSRVYVDSAKVVDKEHGEKVQSMSPSDRKMYISISEVLYTANVGQLIEYLKKNFKPTDKLCYMDCVEGFKNDCTYVTKDMLGKRFFYYVKYLKEGKKDAEDMYPYVKDNDVVVA